MRVGPYVVKPVPCILLLNERTDFQCCYGYSLLLNRPRQQYPSDNQQLIVFILGGISAQEVKLIQDMVISSGQQTQVVVGGTRLLSPNDVVEAILIKDPFMQQVL
jgi:hypothetical protein